MFGNRNRLRVPAKLSEIRLLAVASAPVVRMSE